MRKYISKEIIYLELIQQNYAINIRKKGEK
jgi:hypothetical protein